MAVTATHLEVKILVDKEKSRVLFAEADGEFVDVLFSFLTLPLGAIVKLTGKTRSDPATKGCFSTLYQSVASLGNEHFLAEGLKGMLLHPRSSSEDCCRRLKINIASTEARYFLCPRDQSKYTECSKYMSIYKNAKCPYCFGSMSTMKPLEEVPTYYSKGKVFVTKALKFIVTDDLQVIPVVPKTVIDLLNKLGINDMSVIEERTLNLGLNEFLELLNWTFVSTTPLTDLFLSKKKRPLSPMPNKPSPQNNQHPKELEINVKVVLKKSSREFLFVEAHKDFIDFLFSLLTIPLGEALHIMEGQSYAGGIDGLYNSVRSLDSQYFIYENMRNILLRPKLPIRGRFNRLFSLESTTVSICQRKMPVDIRFFGDQDSRGLVSEDSAFFVLDKLVVTPVSPASTISILSRNNVSVSDLEERTISVGVAEGISILRASLNSNCAISNGLLHNDLIFKEPEQEQLIFKKPKQEK